ncbi:MAG: hypothetical protein JWP38_3605 [Herbaspirillum sp.]|jgi:hypothetical protein|nr:hypothetical protein [Herbaspirillum sp.]
MNAISETEKLHVQLSLLKVLVLQICASQPPSQQQTVQELFKQVTAGVYASLEKTPGCEYLLEYLDRERTQMLSSLSIHPH